ncbi:MAG: insulinase family protein, partial [Pseudomonadota bacterium]|nr:insulinase family protein [Pseudomonadota bacterium]
MRYAIRRNATPKGTASVRLHFDFGSIAEAEDERGLAHFIEHM